MKFILLDKMTKKEYNKKYNQEHKEIKKEYNKIYRQEHIKEIKFYCDNHKEEKRNYNLKYRQYNKRKINDYHKNYNKNKYETNIEFRILCILSKRLWKVLKQNSKKSRTLELLGCSIRQLREHLQSQFRPV